MKKEYTYNSDNEKVSIVQEPMVAYGRVQENDIIKAIQIIKEGIRYASFIGVVAKSPFSLEEWSDFLHISRRTMQRYQKEEKAFDSLHSEKIFQISILYHYGVQVFGSNNNFNTWLEAPSLALGGIKPKNLLDSSFGIGLVTDELVRIEQGVLA
jgi:putative toxin-antitoxin system antitoxin component (TIGR02293 family)